MSVDAAEPGGPLSFEEHIKPMFRETDRESMLFALDLWSYADVSANATSILEQLNRGAMPCDGAWSADRIERFRRWTQTGMREAAH